MIGPKTAKFNFDKLTEFGHIMVYWFLNGIKSSDVNSLIIILYHIIVFTVFAVYLAGIVTKAHNGAYGW